ncbi:RNA polymerase [Rhizocola hellebori]|uniref:RNA polymerase n=1 Tax=Rhizocola hellebori TaxID=1392758 RepID=A0A8J3VG86_9ACTN|nr:RNA polymerase [Rhizocola hellebori]
MAPDDFAEFVRGRHVELLRFAYLLCGDRYLAEDLVQDALERTGMAWHRVQRQDDPEGYVRRTITNRFLNRLRALRSERLVGDPPERGYVDREPPDHALWHLLARLPRQQRAVLVLRFYLDYSEAQIAQTLGCSTGTVKSTTSRALAKLRQQLPANSQLASVEKGAS